MNIYPGLYKTADGNSNKFQRYLVLTNIAEYGIMLLLSVAFLFTPTSKTLLYILTVILAVIFIAKIFLNFDRNWYRARALAESVKTVSWRFMMRAHPFEDADNIGVPRANFRNSLREILNTNKSLAGEMEPDTSEQVSEEMLKIRSMKLEDRVRYYSSDRIDNQRSWYAKKAKYNRRAYGVWATAVVIVYIAIFISISNLSGPFGGIFNALIVLASSLLGWAQLKRYRELASSYSLAAQEISFIKSALVEVTNENEFSDFVNEAELAFSREHTQWAARKDAV